MNTPASEVRELTDSIKHDFAFEPFENDKRHNASFAVALLAHRNRPKEKKPSSVYMIGNLDHGWCKIGVSNDVDRRLRRLQTGCPFPLRLLAVFPNRSYDYEKKMHERLKHLRGEGEWFRIEGVLYNYLREAND